MYQQQYLPAYQCCNTERKKRAGDVRLPACRSLLHRSSGGGARLLLRLRPGACTGRLPQQPQPVGAIGEELQRRWDGVGWELACQEVALYGEGDVGLEPSVQGRARLVPACHTASMPAQ